MSCLRVGPVERKNTWQIAEYTGHLGPYRFQNLLGRAVWDPDRVRDVVRGYVFEQLGQDDGVLIFDETGFIKKGEASAGVAGGFAAYASRAGRALIDRELYLPKSWTGDEQRRAGAGVPEARRFATKPELAVRMMTRILASPAPIRWVTADEAYGQDAKFRAARLHRNVGYVAAVPRSQHVPTTRVGTRRIDTLASQAPSEAWSRISAGDGAKGPRLYDWATACIGAWWDQNNRIGHWVLIRRSITDPTDLAFYPCAGPDQTPIEELVRVAGARWAIEECFQAAKTHTGLDHYEVRSYTGWYKHITLAMLAHAFLAGLAAAQRGPRKYDIEYAPLTVGEIRRLLAGLTRPDHPPPATPPPTALVRLAKTPPSHLPTMPLPATM